MADLGSHGARLSQNSHATAIGFDLKTQAQAALRIRTMQAHANPLRAATLAILLLTGSAWGAAPENAITDIRFTDFFQHPIGRAGLQLNPKITALSGQHVRITGYQVAQDDASAGRFFLSPTPVTMAEAADGDADDLAASTVTVFLPPTQETLPAHYLPGRWQLTGTLHVGRLELPNGRVSWFQLHMDAPTPTDR
jgi:hypothetical protein